MVPASGGIFGRECRALRLAGVGVDPASFDGYWRAGTTAFSFYLPKRALRGDSDAIESPFTGLLSSFLYIYNWLMTDSIAKNQELSSA